MYEYKISVIIPTYNSSKTIERTIHSVLSQDFKDYELVFVDDASTDDTADTILNVLDGENISYQLIVNKTNKGPSYSRNRGMHASKGRHLVFIDSDDVIQYNHLSSLYRHVHIDGIDSVFTKGIKVDADDKLLDFKVDKYDDLLVLARENKGIIRASDLIEMELLMKIPFSFVLLIYDKEIIMENDIFFNEDYDYGEDTDFALRYLANCSCVRIVDKYTYFYYQEEESISRAVSLDRFESVRLFEDLFFYFNDIDFDLSLKLIHSRIPRFIFGNMNYFLYEEYDAEDVFKKMNELGLFDKLSKFRIYERRDWKFYLKLKLFLFNPGLYCKVWLRIKK